MGRASADLGIHDEQLVRISMDQVATLASEAESAAASREPRTAGRTISTCQIQNQTVTLVSSAGFNETYETTSATLTLNASVAGSPDSVSQNQSGGRVSKSVSLAARALNSLKTDKLADKLAERLRTDVETGNSLAGEYPVVFAPSVARGVLGVLLHLCSGASVALLGGSILGKIGEQVCNPLITVVDDGLKPGGLGTAPFDSEGVRPRRLARSRRATSHGGARARSCPAAACEPPRAAAASRGSDGNSRPGNRSGTGPGHPRP